MDLSRDLSAKVLGFLYLPPGAVAVREKVCHAVCNFLCRMQFSVPLAFSLTVSALPCRKGTDFHGNEVLILQVGCSGLVVSHQPE